jgi:hypothetical protein
VSTRHRARAGQWRCTHSRTVVSRTVPQDGGGDAARGRPAGRPLPTARSADEGPPGAGAPGSGPAAGGLPGGAAGGGAAGGAPGPGVPCPAEPVPAGLSPASAAPPARRSSSRSCRSSRTASCAAARSWMDKITASWGASALKSRAGRLVVRDGRPSDCPRSPASPGTGPGDFSRRICGCTCVPHRARKESDPSPSTQPSTPLQTFSTGIACCY